MGAVNWNLIIITMLCYYRQQQSCTTIISAYVQKYTTVYTHWSQTVTGKYMLMLTQSPFYGWSFGSGRWCCPVFLARFDPEPPCPPVGEVNTIGVCSMFAVCALSASLRLVNIQLGDVHQWRVSRWLIWRHTTFRAVMKTSAKARSISGFHESIKNHDEPEQP